jgi:hypothetical protein
MVAARVGYMPVIYPLQKKIEIVKQTEEIKYLRQSRRLGL